MREIAPRGKGGLRGAEAAEWGRRPHLRPRLRARRALRHAMGPRQGHRLARRHGQQPRYINGLREGAVPHTLCADRGEGRHVAIEWHLELLKEFPRDLMSLKRAQLICFYSGRLDTSLKFVEQVLPENQDQNYIYGMLAFPLLELGRIDEAERAARKGLAINKNGCWSQHNLCHVFQQECHFKEATELMKSSSPPWEACSSFMLTHDWWHVAVCYLEGESPTWRFLEVCNHNIIKELEKNDCEAAEVYLNSLGLLLHLYIRGKVDLTKDRLAALLDAFKNELLDILVLWALSIMGEITTADNLLESLRSRVSLMDTKRQQVMQKAIQMIGASDEQVDVFNAGEISNAIDVLGKQTWRQEGTTFLWCLLTYNRVSEDKPAEMFCRRAFLAGVTSVGLPK